MQSAAAEAYINTNALQYQISESYISHHNQILLKQTLLHLFPCFPEEDPVRRNEGNVKHSDLRYNWK